MPSQKNSDSAPKNSPGKKATKAWASKDARQYEHIKESYEEKGQGGRAEEIAARTVNKQRSTEGRTKEQKGESKSPKRSKSRQGKTAKKAQRKATEKAQRNRNDVKKQSPKTKKGETMEIEETKEEKGGKRGKSKKRSTSTSGGHYLRRTSLGKRKTTANQDHEEESKTTKKRK